MIRFWVLNKNTILNNSIIVTKQTIKEIIESLEVHIKISEKIVILIV